MRTSVGVSKVVVAGLVLAAAALGQAGCIVHGQLVAPSRSGTRWVELRSKHFTLATDLEPDEADGVLRTFEHIYTLLARVVFGGQTAPDFETSVFAFRSEGEFREFLPAPLAGVYERHLANDLQSSPTMVIYGALSPTNRVHFTHELAHRFNHVALPSMPVWLNEGLAEFYSTVRGEVDRPVVGELDPDNGFASGSVRSDPNHVVFKGGLIDSAELPRPSALMHLDRDTFYVEPLEGDKARSWGADQKMERNYAAAWAFVHMLMGESAHGQELGESLRNPARRDGFADALRALERNGDDLDREFDLYVKKPMFWREHHEGALPAVGEVRRRDLGDAEVLLLWTRLDSFRGNSAERAARRLQTAAVGSPDDPEVRFWLGRYATIKGNVKEAEQHFKQALALRPASSSYQLALALLYLDDRTGATWPAAERGPLITAAFDRLGEIATTATELDSVAIYHLLKTGPGRAVAPAARACQLEPECWSCFHTYAAAMFQMGDMARAAALERIALDRLPDDAPIKTVHVLTRDRERYDRAAAEPAARKREGTMLFFPD